MKEFVNAFDYASAILGALPQGVLLTTQAGGKKNTMTIGWAHLGIEWGKPTFIAYVRGSRHTHPMLEEAGEFTVNIPLGQADKNILKVCGTRSGRDMDKFAELGLTPEEPAVISTPGIREFPLTLECKVIYKQQQTPDSIVDPHLLRHYPDPCADIRQNYHTLYYGEILSAYIIK